MNRETNNPAATDKTSYMKELTSFLTGLPEDEREEALTYYEEYFDDAGEDEFGRVLEELGSPRQLAAQILSGFGRGYQDREPQSSSGSLPARPEDAAESLRKEQEEARAAERQRQEEEKARKRAQQAAKEKPKRRNNNNKVLMIIVIVLAAFLLIPVGGAGLGLIIAFISVLGSLLLAAVLLMVSLLAGGVVLVVAAFPLMVGAFWDGLLALGGGLALIALGLLSLLAAAAICVKLIPALVRGIVNLCNRMFKRRGSEPNEEAR